MCECRCAIVHVRACVRKSYVCVLACAHSRGLYIYLSATVLSIQRSAGSINRSKFLAHFYAFHIGRIVCANACAGVRARTRVPLCALDVADICRYLLENRIISY